MTWLLWREYRLNRLIAFVGLGLVALPYLFTAVVATYGMFRGWPMSRKPEAIAAAAGYSIGLAQLALVLLGGNAIAGERADRSAEFIAHLPISRGRRVTSKLILSMFAALFIWVSNGLVLFATVMFADKGSLRESEKFFVVGVTIAISALAAYCVAWLISSLQSSPTFAICGGLVTPLVIVFAIQAVCVWILEMERPEKPVLYVYLTICLLVSVSSFVAGTWYFLQRTEP